MPSFSVIIPLYNKSPYVAKAIRSVLSQTFTDWELIIVDDGSSDNSADIAMQTIDGQGNCRLIKQENAGVSMARNNGVAASRGQYLCFLDADDWWEPTFLEEMSKLIEEYPDAGVYGTNYTIVNETKHKTRVAPIGVDSEFEKGYINYCRTYAKTLAMPMLTSAICTPRLVFDENGGFPAGIKLGEDFLLWLRIALTNKVVLLNKPLSNYNQDVDVTYRGTYKKVYDPDTFSTFHFDQFAAEERSNGDLKVLLDKLRVYSLMVFRQNNQYSERVMSEVSKVDFSNVEPIFKFYYRAPFWMVRTHLTIIRFLSLIKQRIV